MSIIVIFKKFLRNFKFSEIFDKNLSYLYRAQNIYATVATATAAFHYAQKAPCKGERHQTAKAVWYSELYLFAKKVAKNKV